MLLRRSPKLLRQVLLLGDIVVTLLSFLAAYYIRELLLPVFPRAASVEFENLSLYIIMICFTWWILLYFQDVYISQRFTSLGSEIFTVIKTIFWGTLLLLLLGYLSRDYTFPRTLMVIFLFTNFIFLAFEKMFVFRLFRYLRRNGFNRKKVLIVGDGKIAVDFMHNLENHPDWGLDVLGYLSADYSKIGIKVNGSSVIGTYDQMLDILHSNFIEEVIIALPVEDFVHMREIFEICEREGIRTRLISRFLNNVALHLSVDVVNGLPILTYSPYKTKELQLLGKRLLDFSIAFLLMIPLGFVVFPLIALLIKLDSPGPVFYGWRVVGLDKKKFNSYKFRTMYVDADKRKAELMKENEMSGPVFKIKDDPRITSVGKWLRKFSLDELPQIFSVLKGDMSLVGPRPPLQSEVEQFESWHRRKLSVRPGMTCLWQVNGRNEINDFDDWVKLDLEYIDNWSLWLDMKILFKTIPVVLFGKGH
ncbi:MAG: sugar transferase [Calditrichaceae bacterium]